MAVQCATGDVHLINSTATGFTAATDPFSVVVWINAVWNTTTVGSYVGIYGPAPTPTSAVQIGVRTNTLTVWTFGGGVLVAAPTAPTSNVWNHIGYTYDGTTHRLYVNGALVNTSTTAQLAGQFEMVCINGYPTGLANETSTHQVDSYAYYNRVLSTEEILTMANAQGARHNIVNGLIAAYEFDELTAGATATAVTDLSGNGNHLSRTGAGTAQITYVYNNTAASSNLRRVH